ncbi:MAG: tetratricopeptide repeat protein [Prevotella sp.]|nr:tetratricopeptide repeat protein [Prevotella sp.]
MKKKLCILTLMSAMAVTIAAQTCQKGMVRTAGSSAPSGKAVKGKRLGAVIIEVDGGKEVMSDETGQFTLVIPRKTYFLKNVIKQGYRLLDDEVLTRQYFYSENVHEIVMVNIAQSAEARLSQMQRSTATMQKQLKLQQDEITRMRNEKQINEEEYRRRLAELTENNEKIQSRADELAEHLSRIDYDRIDEQESEVLRLIDDGMLDSADSLLHAMCDIHAAVNNHRETMEQLNRDKAKHPDRVDQYGRKIRRQQERGETLAALCLDHYSIAQLRFDTHSAEDYIELRASIDTSEIKWQMDAAAFHTREKHIAKAMNIYTRLISWLRPSAVAEPSRWDAALSAVLNNMAILHNDRGETAEAEQLYREALSIRQRLAMTANEVYAPYVAQTQNNLAVLFQTTDKTKQAEKLLTAALATRRTLAESNPVKYGADKAVTMVNLAAVYAEQRQHERSAALYLEALDTYNQLIHNGFSAYEADRAAVLNNLAVICRIRGDLKQSEKYWWDALTAYCHLTQRNHQRHYSHLQSTLGNLLDIYDANNCECLEKRLTVYRLLAGNLPADYAPTAAQLMNTLADCYDRELNTEKSKELYTEALTTYEKLAKNNAPKYTPYVARQLGNLSFHHLLTGKFDIAEEYARRGLQTDPAKTFIQANLAAALLLRGKYTEAESIYSAYKDELRSSFLEDLQTFAERGIIPDERKTDVEKIKNLLRDNY